MDLHRALDWNYNLRTMPIRE